MAVIRGLDKRGDPRKPFTRRPDFCYLGNFTSCLLGFGAAGQVRSLTGTAGRLVFSRGLAAQVADLHRVTGGEMQSVSALAGLHSYQRHGLSTNPLCKDPFRFSYTYRKRPASCGPIAFGVRACPRLS